VSGRKQSSSHASTITRLCAGMLVCCQSNPISPWAAGIGSGRIEGVRVKYTGDPLTTRQPWGVT